MLGVGAASAGQPKGGWLFGEGGRFSAQAICEEDRALLLEHVFECMPQHYATTTVARLVGAANMVAYTVDQTTLLRVVNG
jgi:hypothetical protein